MLCRTHQPQYIATHSLFMAWSTPLIFFIWLQCLSVVEKKWQQLFCEITGAHVDDRFRTQHEAQSMQTSKQASDNVGTNTMNKNNGPIGFNQQKHQKHVAMGEQNKRPPYHPPQNKKTAETTVLMWSILTKFDQIFTKSDKILIIYDKTH